MKNYESVRDKNISINKELEKLIEIMKENKIKTFNENGELKEDIRQILEYELQKCIKLYCFEYGFEAPTEELSVHEARLKDKDGSIKINTNPELNARGDTDGVQVYSGLQKALDMILPKARISCQELEDGKIHATQVYGKDIVSTNISGENYVSSNRDNLDYFSELLETKKIDLDFILDVFPHEAMHVFIPGQGVFVEGTTERLAREASDKYGLRLTPTSHSKETAIISKLEEILGRDIISSIALTNEQKELRKDNKDLVDNTRFEILKKAFDEKIGDETFDFDKLKFILDQEYDEFLSYRTKPDEFQRYRNETFSNTIKLLDDWIRDNPDKLHSSSNIRDLNEEQKTEILEIQNNQYQLIHSVIEKVQQKNIDEIDKPFGNEIISMQEVVRNAITSGIAIEDINKVENLEKTNDKNSSEVSRND